MKVFKVGAVTWNWIFANKPSKAVVTSGGNIITASNCSLSARFVQPTLPSWGAVSWSLSLPNEMWGAFNAVSYALQPQPAKGRQAASKKLLQPLHKEQMVCRAGLAAELSVHQALDFKPNLSLLEAFQCIALSAAVCTAVWWIQFRDVPPAVRPALLIALLFTLCLTISRNAVLEYKYKAVQRREDELRDPDSLFINVEGIAVHAKSKQAHGLACGSSVAIHCYHGFGANTFSWQEVQQALADELSGQVTSHDMTGFGLTQRPTAISSYSLSFNGRVGRVIMDRKLQDTRNTAASTTGPDVHDLGETDKGSSGSPGKTPSVTRVLMGHSLGSACAAAEVINHPEGIDALVFIAPAIVAYRLTPSQSPKPSAATVASVGEQLSADTDKLNESASSRSSILETASAVIRTALSSGVALLLILLRPVLVLLLRSVVRNKEFWQKGLRAAWSNEAGVTQKVVDAYRLPQLVIGWEDGLTRFLLARVSVVSPLWRAFSNRRLGTQEGGRSQAQKLADTVKKHNIKVLLIHGEDDRIVPVANSVRLADILPNCELLVLPQCGHVPQEECPEQVINSVKQWMDKVM